MSKSVYTLFLDCRKKAATAGILPLMVNMRECHLRKIDITDTFLSQQGTNEKVDNLVFLEVAPDMFSIK